MVAWITESYFYLLHYRNISSYKPVKYGLTADAVGIVANTCNLIVVAVVIYKSAKQVRRQDKTILEGMVNKYAIEQEKKNNNNVITTT